MTKQKTTYLKHREARLLRTYGLSMEDYDKLLTAQQGRCAICGGKRTYNLQVDHSHSLSKIVGVRRSIRGLLCKRCNGLLFRVRDNPTLLRSAASYLEHRHKATQGLLT